MRTILFALMLSALPASAAVGDIRCLAKQFEISNGAMINVVEKPLVLENRIGSSITLTADIGERGFVLSGDTVKGDFLLTQAWGQDYTTGINTAGSFTSTGRMTISLVEVNKVFKLECTKTLASDFPAE